MLWALQHENVTLPDLTQRVCYMIYLFGKKKKTFLLCTTIPKFYTMGVDFKLNCPIYALPCVIDGN